MFFTRESRIDVNDVESDFINYKNKHPEVDEIWWIVRTPLWKTKIFTLQFATDC